MAVVTVLGGNITPLDIETTDRALDRLADLIQQLPAEAAGFWLIGNLEIEGDDDAGDPRLSFKAPRTEHRVWIPKTALVVLRYDGDTAGDEADGAPIIYLDDRR